MHDTIPQPSTNTELTAAQAADVVRYYHDGENRETRARGWKDKVALGRAASRAASELHSILPDGGAALTEKEMGRGLDHILVPPKSDTYYDHLDEIVDKRNVSYDEAREIADQKDDDA